MRDNFPSLHFTHNHFHVISPHILNDRKINLINIFICQSGSFRTFPYKESKKKKKWSEPMLLHPLYMYSICTSVTNSYTYQNFGIHSLLPLGHREGIETQELGELMSHRDNPSTILCESCLFCNEDFFLSPNSFIFNWQTPSVVYHVGKLSLAIWLWKRNNLIF